MSRRTYSDRSGRRGWRAAFAGALLAALLVPALASAQSVEDKYRNRDSNFNLAASPTTVLTVNQYQCGLVSNGATCTDVFDSPTGGGGFWPTGSPNQYMFNSGIQVVGIITAGAGCTATSRANGTAPDCFPWSGDTVGAFFMDASGLRQHGAPVTPIFDSLNPDDVRTCGDGGVAYPNCWPGPGDVPDFPFASAYVTDTTLFNDVLIGRKAASQQDSWVMYWDGDPARTGGREHPMGIAVEQRTLAWNYPTGNESVVYIIYKFTNVTNNPLFQRLSETRYAIALPDAGWRIDSMYVSYLSDPDVTVRFDLNYSTAVLPFNLGLAYDGQFFAPEFIYPPALFHAPFFTDAPGLIGIKYLKSPINPATGEEVGLTSFSLTTNGAPFNDPRTVQQGWRYVSLNVDQSKGDPVCTFTDPDEIRARRSCFLNQQTADVRFFVGSGPFSLDPGASATIAVAQYAAATVETSLIARGDGAAPQNAPGFPTLAPGCSGNPVRPIDIAAGYPATVPAGLCPADPADPIDQYELAPHVVQGSLLGKAMVAQAIFDNEFLLGFAPETPPFFLVSGDNQVTVVWEPSATETTGDPFFVAAGDPENALFDPNYRQFDVEGYRIYRGTSPSNLELIAQFDKSGSVFTDVLCVTDPTVATGEPCDDVHEVDITDPFVQNITVARLQSGDPIVLDADTALSEQIAAGTAVPLSNTGIPFAFVDTDVRNGFQYFYRVTAFDINSVRSGPTSLESAGPTKSVLPQAAATSLTDAEFTVGLFGRGTELAIGDVPAIDPATGTFAGPMPPTNAFSANFVAFAPQLLPPGTYAIRVDSVLPGYYGGEYHMTNLVSGQQFTVGGTQNDALAAILSGTAPSLTFDLPVVSVASEPTLRQELRNQGVDAPPIAGALNTALTLARLHWSSAQMNWSGKQPGFWNIDPPNDQSGGSRWFEGANESTPDPTLGETTAGALTGINTMFIPQPYIGMAAYQGSSSDLLRRFYQSTWALNRSADMRVYWGAAGVDSVIDVTHNVPVPFSVAVRASWGFIPDSDNDGVLNWGDLTRLTGHTPPNISRTPKMNLSQTPVVLPVDINGDLGGDGSGFAMLIAGEPFYFQGAVPSNTVWTLRTYHGAVTRSGGQYAFNPTHRNPAVPGLAVQVVIDAPAEIVAAEADLTRVHTVPDPYYATSLFDLGPTTKELQFVNMPAQGTIRIYSLSGVLVDVINHNDPVGGGVAKWDLRNRSNQFVASGVYLFHVSTPDGKSHIGKFTVVNSGFQR